MLRPLASPLALLLGTAAFLGPLLPQASAQQPAATEPPSVVGRIAEVSGTVSHKAAAATEWEKAERNWPIVAGDAIYAATDGNARLEIGAASVSVRPNAVVDLAALDDRSVSLRANSGTSGIATASGAAPFTLLMPRGSASLGPDGLYRVSAGDETAPTELAVCRGGAVLADGRRLREGEVATLSGDAAAPQIAVAAGAHGTCDAAPIRETRLPPKVSRRMTGIRDLGDRGRWSRTPAGADVWFPDDVAEDWAPYRHGRWSWVAPWGWTWVDDAPWGFAPFHYGRWSEIEGRWGWQPGEYAEHPVYAPAMVAFVEPPPDAIASSDPAFGWVPLGPDEVYRPYYATPGLDYARRINMNVAGVGAATIAALIAAPLAIAALRNRRAATVVPVAVVNSGRPIAPAVLQTRPQVLASVPVKPAGQPLLPRAPGAPRMPGLPGRPPVLAPPRPIPPLTTRPTMPVPRPPGAGPVTGPGSLPVTRGPAVLTPPVVAPGRLPPGRGPGAGPVVGRPPLGAPGMPVPSRPAGSPPVVGTSGGPVPRPGGPVARPLPAPQPGPVARPGQPPRSVPGQRTIPAPRPPGPVARPVPRPAPVPRQPPVMRPGPVARPAPPSMPRPAPPVARPAPPIARPAPPVARPAAPAVRALPPAARPSQQPNRP